MSIDNSRNHYLNLGVAISVIGTLVGFVVIGAAGCLVTMNKIIAVMATGVSITVIGTGSGVSLALYPLWKKRQAARKMQEAANRGLNINNSKNDYSIFKKELL